MTHTNLVRGDIGLENQKLQAKPILGISDRLTVKVDFDEMSFKLVQYWAKLAMKKFNLNGLVILKSSKKSYHIVFDAYAESWEENLSIIAWLAVVAKAPKLKAYLAMQCIKRSSTLRVTSKGDKPSPRIVYKYGNQDQAIKDFLEYRAMIKKITKEVK